MTNLIATRCPLCLAAGDDRLLYAATFCPEQLTPEHFSPRRHPDQVHYRMVVCKHCGLIRANPVVPDEELAALYKASVVPDLRLAQYAATTYMRYFQRYLADVPVSARILEVGCSSGAFLRALQEKHFNNINGIEPSREAVAQAGEVSGLIYNGILGPGIYPMDNFDVICAFHVFDHLSDPKKFLSDCCSYLRRQGRLFLIMHDIAAWPARLLGQACPIIDIEHPFLYNPGTLTRLLESQGFEVQKRFRVYNCYPLRYWVQLIPFSPSIKKQILAYLQTAGPGRMPLTLAAGNMGVIARKKHE